MPILLEVLLVASYAVVAPRKKRLRNGPRALLLVVTALLVAIALLAGPTTLLLVV